PFFLRGLGETAEASFFSPRRLSVIVQRNGRSVPRGSSSHGSRYPLTTDARVSRCRPRGSRSSCIVTCRHAGCSSSEWVPLKAGVHGREEKVCAPTEPG